MAPVLIARWVARAGEEAAVAAILAELTAASRAEPGNLVYQPHRDPADPRVFLLYESYADEAAFQAHCDSEHFRRLVLERAMPLLESRDRSFYEPL